MARTSPFDSGGGGSGGTDTSDDEEKKKTEQQSTTESDVPDDAFRTGSDGETASDSGGDSGSNDKTGGSDSGQDVDVDAGTEAINRSYQKSTGGGGGASRGTSVSSGSGGGSGSSSSGGGSGDTGGSGGTGDTDASSDSTADSDTGAEDTELDTDPKQDLSELDPQSRHGAAAYRAEEQFLQQLPVGFRAGIQTRENIRVERVEGDDGAKLVPSLTKEGQQQFRQYQLEQTAQQSDQYDAGDLEFEDGEIRVSEEVRQQKLQEARQEALEQAAAESDEYDVGDLETNETEIFTPGRNATKPGADVFETQVTIRPTEEAQKRVAAETFEAQLGQLPGRADVSEGETPPDDAIQQRKGQPGLDVDLTGEDIEIEDGQANLATSGEKKVFRAQRKQVAQQVDEEDLRVTPEGFALSETGQQKVEDRRKQQFQERNTETIREINKQQTARGRREALAMTGIEAGTKFRDASIRSRTREARAVSGVEAGTKFRDASVRSRTADARERQIKQELREETAKDISEQVGLNIPASAIEIEEEETDDGVQFTSSLDREAAQDAVSEQGDIFSGLVSTTESALATPTRVITGDTDADFDTPGDGSVINTVKFDQKMREMDNAMTDDPVGARDATDSLVNDIKDFDLDSIGARVSDIDDSGSGGKVVAAGAVGVAAPEPVSSGTGALILGGAAATAIGLDVARRQGTFKDEGLADVVQQRSELEVPEEAGSEELTTPEEPIQQESELEVPQGQRRISASELGLPEDSLSDDRVSIRGDAEVEDGELIVPIETTAVAKQKRYDEEEEEDEVKEEREEDEEEVVVEVPEEMIPDETVVIGAAEGSEPADESTEDVEEAEPDEVEGEEELPPVEDFQGQRDALPDDTRAREDFDQRTIQQEEFTGELTQQTESTFSQPEFTTISASGDLEFQAAGGFDEMQQPSLDAQSEPLASGQFDGELSGQGDLVGQADMTGDLVGQADLVGDLSAQADAVADAEALATGQLLNQQPIQQQQLFEEPISQDFGNPALQGFGEEYGYFTPPGDGTPRPNTRLKLPDMDFDDGDDDRRKRFDTFDKRKQNPVATFGEVVGGDVDEEFRDLNVDVGGVR